MTTYLFHLMFLLPLALVVMAVRGGRRARKRAGTPARRPVRTTWGVVQLFQLEEGTGKYMAVFSGDIAFVWTSECLRGILLDGYEPGETVPILASYGANWIAFTLRDLDGAEIAPVLDIGYTVLWLGDAYHETPPRSARATIGEMFSGTNFSLDQDLFAPGDVIQDEAPGATELLRVIKVESPTVTVQRGYRSTVTGILAADVVLKKVGTCIDPDRVDLIHEASGATFSPTHSSFNTIPSIG